MHRHDHDHDHETSAADVRRAAAAPPLLMRAAAEGRADVLGAAGMLHVQRTAGNGAAAGLAGERSPVLDVVSGGGSALEEPVRRDMESRMGHDFSDVRVHTDAAADHSARSVSAHAYTVGSSIVFQRGADDPGSTAGRTLLAHELTHVVQQRSGPVDGTATGNGVRVSDPSDRFEQAAAANAERVMSQPVPVQASLAPASAPSPSVQREAAPEEEEVQASHDPSLPTVSTVQREEAEEEEPAS
jgi:hypothetical protein